jgi:hypothetical protein
MIIHKRSKVNGKITEITLEEAISDLEKFDSETKLEFINETAVYYYFRMAQPQTDIYQYSIMRREGNANFYYV